MDGSLEQRGRGQTNAFTVMKSQDSLHDERMVGTWLKYNHSFAVLMSIARCTGNTSTHLLLIVEMD
jgi:hypothetical protein